MTAPLGPGPPAGRWLRGLGWRLGRTAALAAVVAAAPTVVIALWLGHGRAGLAAALGAAVGVALFSLGQLAQIVSARWNVHAVLAVAFVTYGVQLAAAAALIGALAGRLSATWLFVGLAAAVVGWVVGLIVAFRHARQPVFDSLFETP